MGGFANVLGHAAAGFEQARQQDLTRQFSDEQNRRAMAGELMGKIIMDPNQPAEVRTAFTQAYLGMSNQPFNKPFNFQKQIGPLFELMAKYRAAGQQQAPQVATPPAPPGLTTAAAQAAQPAQPAVTPPNAFPGASMLPQGVPPPPPPPAGQPGMAPTSQATTGATMAAAGGPPTPAQAGAPQEFLAGPETIARNAARMAGAVGGQEMKQLVYTLDPTTGQMKAMPISATGQPMGAGIENAFNPMIMRGLAGFIHPISIVGQDGVPIPALQNKLTGEIYDQDMNLIPGAQLFTPSLVSRTGTESMSPSGAITRTTTPSPRKPGGGAAAPAAGAPAKGGGAAAGGGRAAAPQAGNPATNWATATDPVALAGIRWATQGQKPAGGAMGERQVMSWMSKHGLEPALPVPPALQRTIQEQFQMRNSAIDLIDDIVKNREIFNSLISAGKVSIASNPDGSGIVQRAANLTDQEARVAGDFQQLVEHANLLRGPLGATGFRGKEAWGALQAQRGKALADPRITQQVLGGMKDRLLKLNSADKMVLSGHGMEAPGTTPEAPPATGGGSKKFDWGSHPVIR